MKVCQAKNMSVLQLRIPSVGYEHHILSYVLLHHEPWASTQSQTLALTDSVVYDSVVSAENVAVQINGKLRATIELPLNCDKDLAIATAKADERVAPFIEGKTVVKEIVVPNKIINIVVK